MWICTAWNFTQDSLFALPSLASIYKLSIIIPSLVLHHNSSANRFDLCLGLLCQTECEAVRLVE